MMLPVKITLSRCPDGGTGTEISMTLNEDDITLASDHPGFGAAVVVATRALIEQVAVWASEGRTSTGTGVIIEVSPLTAQPNALSLKSDR